MRRTLRSAVAAVLLCSILAGCAVTDNSEAATADVITESTTVATTEATTEPTTEATTTTEPEPKPIEFKPKVMSSLFRDIMGDDMCEAYYSYIDALMNGEDTFAVKSEDDYGWMLGQFPCNFSPVVDKFVGSDYASGYKKGRGKFNYLTSREDFVQKEAEFEKLVTDILGETMNEDFTDFEKVFALYIYFADNYKYDYDTLEKMKDDPFVELSPYNFLMEKTGICSECAPAFSYLLLQAGVDATVVGGGDHCWSYVTIGGKNYHVDPTFAMSSGDNLAYLMMTDEQREAEGDFVKKDMTVACHYKGQYNGEKYTADDDYFAPLWNGFLLQWDRENKKIDYSDYSGNVHTFDYSSFE